MRPIPAPPSLDSRTTRLIQIGALCTCLALSFPQGALAFKLKWKPIDRGLLEETKAQVDSSADAEALFYEIHIQDTIQGDMLRLEFECYERIKIYNERGQAACTQVEIPYAKGTSVEDIAARTIRKDGTIAELKGSSVFDKTLLKGRGFKARAKSFALPAVEGGCVVEYQWTEVRHSSSVGASVYPAQLAIPIRDLTIFLKPVADPDWPYEMRLRGLNLTFPLPKTLTDGSVMAQIHGIRAIGNEPHMPPADQVRGWLVVDYIERNEPDIQEFWMRLARDNAKTFGRIPTPSKEIRRVADSLTTGVAEFEPRIQRLYDFCRSRIKNVYDDANGFTDEFQKQLTERNLTPETTLRERIGTPYGIEMLFASLASAAGFKARIALVTDRSETFFDPSARLPGSLNNFMVAVHVVASWRFYDPAVPYVNCGMLPWWEEGEDALILDEDHPEFVTTSLSSPDASLERRTARMRLDENGNLEGDIRIEETGHLAHQRKEDLDEKSPEAREDLLRKEIRAQWATAKISDVSIGGIADPFAPPSVSYHVMIPQYAQRVGRRLLLRPGLFQVGQHAPFPSSNRRYSIYFHYPSSEDDSVLLELPTGYTVESDPVPSPLSSGRMISHRIQMSLSSDSSKMLFRRWFRFGDDATLLVPASEYEELKRYFDTMQANDSYSVTLTPSGAESSQR